jgi:hypothetical protein
MNDDLRWEEPPPAKRGRRGGGIAAYQVEADAMRAAPGRWAVLRSVPRANSKVVMNLSHSVRTGAATVFRPIGAWEATVRTVDDEVRLYVRYIGDGPS